MPQNALILGGSGFIGNHLAIQLANRGWQVTIPSRRPHRHRDLLVHPHIRVVGVNPTETANLKALCQNQQLVVNLIGILNETHKGDFRRIHVDFVNQLVASCSEAGVRRLLHVSALGADQGTGNSLYLRSKGEGENLLHTFGQRELLVTSFQPSVVFGKGDQFINRFAKLLKWYVGYFPLACAQSKMAPVYVGDLVKRIADSIDDAQSYAKRYQICGPEVFSLQQILELIIYRLHSRCRVMPLGPGMSKLQAVALQNLPGKIFTMDNYRSLQVDNICPGEVHEQTSLRHYLLGLSHLFGNRSAYDNFRMNYAVDRDSDNSR